MPIDSKIALQTATTEHADGISVVIRNAIEQINAKDYPPSEVDRLMQNFTSDKVLDLMGRRQTLVAMSDGRVIGTGALQDTKVKSVFVAPEWNGRGVGTALMKELEKRALQHGYKSLDVLSSLSAAGFYEAFGYIERTRKFYGDEETIMMSKAL